MTRDSLPEVWREELGLTLVKRSARVVRLRMKSHGRRHRPFFRICAMDSRTGRDATPIEELGHYDPMVADPKTQTVLNVSRLRYWLSVGAQPSHKVQVLLNKFGVKKPAPGEPWQVATEVAAPAAAPAAPAEEQPAAPQPVGE
jgi:small subunit ribosomal protein S16